MLLWLALMLALMVARKQASRLRLKLVVTLLTSKRVTCCEEASVASAIETSPERIIAVDTESVARKQASRLRLKQLVAAGV